MPSPNRADTPSNVWGGFLCRVPGPNERFVRVLAGVVSLTGLGLGLFISPWWYLLTGVAGLNLIQSAFTGFCPPEVVYRWFHE